MKAVITPGNPRPPEVDANVFDAAYSHAHERLLQATGRKLRVTLTGKLRTCEGFVVSKGFCHFIPSTTDCRSTKKLGCVFVDLSGLKEVAAFDRT